MKLLKTNWIKIVNLLLIVCYIPLSALMCYSSGEEEFLGDPFITDGGEYIYYDAVTMTRAELDSSIVLHPPQEIHQAGKMYLRGNLIFLNDRYKGIHIINNIDPSNPQRIAFIEIPGNLDMAVKGNMMYVDNSKDLVTLDISSPSNARVVKRIRNVLPEPLPPGHSSLPWYEGVDNPDIIVVNWIESETY